MSKPFPVSPRTELCFLSLHRMGHLREMFVHADADNKTSMQFTIEIDSIKNT